MSEVSSIGFDYVLAGGTLVDGSGEPARLADVVVAGGRIEDVRPPLPLNAWVPKRGEVIDVRGQLVCPGFFDIHSHADSTLLKDGRAHSAVLQGVTSLVTGNCGFGAAPLVGRASGIGSPVASRYDSLTFGEYMDALGSSGVGPNVFPLVAHGAVRASVAGMAARRLSRQELREACELVSDAVAHGAIGISSGLEYHPGMAADVGELSELARAVGFPGLYATHIRDRSAKVTDAVQEATSVASAGGLRLQLSHFLRRPTFAPMDPFAAASARVLHARAEGLTVHSDVFPFEYGPTPLAAFLPDWAAEGTRSDVAARLSSTSERQSVRSAVSDRLVALLDSGAAETMFIANDGADGSRNGMTLQEASGETPVIDTILNLLADAGGDRYDSVVVLENWAEWSDLTAALADADYFVMGDGVTSSLDGEQARRGGFSMSDWGYAPEFLARFVRDLELVEVEDAVHRMTLGPARQAGIPERGRLAPGWHADVVVLDLEALETGITPRDLRGRPRGIRQVMVNGAFVVRDGMPTDRRPGVVGGTVK